MTDTATDPNTKKLAMMNGLQFQPANGTGYDIGPGIEYVIRYNINDMTFEVIYK